MARNDNNDSNDSSMRICSTNQTTSDVDQHPREGNGSRAGGCARGVVSKLAGHVVKQKRAFFFFAGHVHLIRLQPANMRPTHMSEQPTPLTFLKKG